MVNLFRKSNTSTGVHMLQRSGDKYKFRTSEETLKRLTSVTVKPEYQHLFQEPKDGVYHSELFDDIETGTEELIKFIYKVCGVRCKVE